MLHQRRVPKFPSWWKKGYICNFKDQNIVLQVVKIVKYYYNIVQQTHTNHSSSWMLPAKLWGDEWYHSSFLIIFRCQSTLIEYLTHFIIVGTTCASDTCCRLPNCSCFSEALIFKGGTRDNCRGIHKETSYYSEWFHTRTGKYFSTNELCWFYPSLQNFILYSNLDSHNSTKDIPGTHTISQGDYMHYNI